MENVDETIRRIDDVAYNRCEPPISVIIETVIDNDKTVIIINVPKGDQRPYRTSSGNYYIRSANRFRLASREELLRLFQATESIYYDETTIYKATLKDLDNDAFRLFMKEYMNIEVSEEMLINYMKNLKILSKDEKPTLAGILFLVQILNSLFQQLKWLEHIFRVLIFLHHHWTKRKSQVEFLKL
ncbi:Putative DNA-binding domain-containing protein [Candidatus Kryptonium thompsonii]|nr:Putative DNA-binding domain-containing protein [Candidatus Kryptonium thompsoni]